MTARTLTRSAAASIFALSLGLTMPACDKPGEESGPALPDATGDKAPARAEIPTPTKANADTRASAPNRHRWVGSVQAKHHVELAPGMTGVIASIEVEEGDMVEAGQRVFRIEGSGVKLAVGQAQAALAAAEVQLAEAERETERTRKLAERGSVGAANLERAQASADAAAAGVKQAKAAVSMARARSSDLTVDSPISGVVTSKYKNVGEVATMMPPTTIVVIDDLSTVEVRVRVPELKLREVDIGSPVIVYFPALDEQREVPVTRIGNAVDPRTRTIELIIEVENEDLRIKSGMSVELELGRREPVDDTANDSDARKASDERPQADGPTPTAMVHKPG